VSSLRKPFQLNRDEGKVMGVCAGIADHFDIDVTLVRVGMALTILATFPLMLVVYFIMARWHSKAAGTADARPAPTARARRSTERGRDPAADARPRRPHAVDRDLRDHQQQRAGAENRRAALSRGRKTGRKGKMETMQTTLILAAFSFAAFAAALMAGLKMWQGWLDLKRAELGSKRGRRVRRRWTLPSCGSGSASSSKSRLV
jgi:phage shock protein PspC (stress-responsive transcriptional regulator)